MKKILLVTRILKFVLLLISFGFLVFAPLFTIQVNEHQTLICNGYVAIFGGNFGFGTGVHKLSPVALIAFIFLLVSLIWNIVFNVLQLTKKEIPLKVFKRISYVVAILQITAGVLAFYSLYNFAVINDYGSTIPEYFKNTYFYTLSGCFALMSGLLNAFEILAL